MLKEYFISKRKLKNQIRDLKMHTTLLNSALRDEGNHAKGLYQTRLDSERHHTDIVRKGAENSKLQVRIFELENQLFKIKEKPIPPVSILRGIRYDRIDAIMSIPMEIPNIHAVEITMQGGHKVSTIMDSKDVERYTNKIKGYS